MDYAVCKQLMKINLKIRGSRKKKRFPTTFGGKGEIENQVGSWLVSVTAAGNGRMTVQTLFPCMDCELCLFARDSQAEMPLVSPDEAQGLGFSVCFECDIVTSSLGSLYE